MVRTAKALSRLSAESVCAARADSAAREVMNAEDMPISIRVTVKVQKETGFSAIAHNDTVFRLVETGMITPEVGLEMIVFEGKDQAKALMEGKAAS